ncbi:hypothetical protein AXG93_496s1350 [Marchantia polymorpha subsp. ruderalis]|uniref:WDR5-like beta-propeller domain-containing protein n=2 Tax=Marchantia polymorpha TaxID=3197 RepID=A0A176VPM3_MARPO|nr:hypothetical protein AXG93_496s1350 [Marchantia polymorpha subsp. ruderalis]
MSSLPRPEIILEPAKVIFDNVGLVRQSGHNMTDVAGRQIAADDHAAPPSSSSSGPGSSAYVPFVLKLTLSGHRNAISSVKFSPDRQWIGSSSADKTVIVWRISSGTVEGKLEEHEDGINDFDWSPNMSFIVTASDDRTLRIWSLRTWTCVRILRGHTSIVFCCNFRPDSKRIVSGSFDETVRIWNTTTGVEKKTIMAHFAPVTAVCFNPNGRLVVSTSFDGMCRIWDAKSGNLLKTVLENKDLPVSFARFIPGGKLILIATHDSILRCYLTQTGELYKTYKGHTNQKYCMFSQEMADQYIVSGSEDNYIYIWDCISEHILQKFEAHKRSEDPVIAVACQVDGKCRMIASGGHLEDKTVKLWVQERQEPAGPKL